jgi:hypothetical protein
VPDENISPTNHMTAASLLLAYSTAASLFVTPPNFSDSTAKAARDSMNLTGVSARRAVDDTTRRPKPLVRRTGAGTIIGGYVDLEYHNLIDQHRSVFDQHRLVPFISAQISNKLHFSTEIEFEHAARLENSGGEAEGAGEVSVEFAHLDYTLHPNFTVRAGVILEPLGYFNTNHDSPLNELTTRPLMNRYIIPSVLREPGVGVTGAFPISSSAYITYDAYVVNGFTSGILSEEGIRVGEGGGLSEEDNNFAKSFVGRLGIAPFSGLEVGVSAHTGKYAAQEGDFTGDERLTITALDAEYRIGDLALIGQYASLKADLPTVGEFAGMANGQNGYYAEADYSFGFRPASEGIEESFWTAVARWERVDLAAGRGGDLLERMTLGLNWRPLSKTVFKLSYEWGWTTAPGLTERGVQDRAVRASVASYF